MKIEKRYMKLPVNRHAAKVSLRFLEEGKLIWDHNVLLDCEHPEYEYYVDLRELLGKELDFETLPASGYRPELVDLVPTDGLYRELHRPKAHFTASRGWINDPNGLCYDEGKYHLFYQHNPAGMLWENMSWGHAVSEDLLHWEEKEIALFPDELGSMYSGSAVIDRENRTGLKETEHDVILLYYTACPAQMALSCHSQTSQCLAYSVDGGETFHKYSRNPLIPNIIGDNRDPKVVWAEEENCYYMALYLDMNDFMLFRSDNLLDWEIVQTLTVPGAAECPDFYPLYTERGERYWVFSDASDRYLIGKLEYGRFEPKQYVRRLHYGSKSYAAQTYYNTPDGRRIRMAWNQSAHPTASFTGSMGTPTEMYLSEDADGIALCVRPIKELALLHQSFEGNNFPSPALDITLTLDISENAKATLSLFGLDMTLDAASKTLTVKDCTLPLSIENEYTTLRIITDTTSAEIYNAGRFACVEHIADLSQNSLRITAIEECTGIERYEMHALGSIWEK